MGNYVIYPFLLILYAVITGTAISSRSPLEPAAYVVSIAVQFVLVTATCFAPIWWPISSVLGWILWAIYCCIMFFFLLCQAICCTVRLIDVDKVYDCIIWGKVQQDAKTIYLGGIRVWKFSVPVALVDCEQKNKGDCVKVEYKEGDYGPLFIRRYLNERQAYQEMYVVLYVTETKV